MEERVGLISAIDKAPRSAYFGLLGETAPDLPGEMDGSFMSQTDKEGNQSLKLI